MNMWFGVLINKEIEVQKLQLKKDRLYVLFFMKTYGNQPNFMMEKIFGMN